MDAETNGDMVARLKETAAKLAIPAPDLPEPFQELRSQIREAIERRLMKDWLWRYKSMEAVVAIARKKPDPAAFIREFFAMGLGELVPVTEDELMRDVHRKRPPIS